MSLFSFLFFVLSVVGERQQTRTRERTERERERERERTERERTEKDFSAAFLDNWTLEKKTQRKKRKKREREKEREGERTCGARWLSCAFFENDVDTKKKKKRRMPCHGASLLIALQHTHTHTRTHNVRFTIPNRRRQGRLQSCRQEATTIHRRFGEDFPRQRCALEKQRKRLIIESHKRIPGKGG